MKNPLSGGTYLIAVILIWVASSTTIHTVFSTYPKPFFLTYFTSSLFSLYLTFNFLKPNPKLINRDLLITSFKFSPLWFTSNYFFNLSLNLTSVASNTILASTSGIFTLIFSILILKEPSNILKWTAVLMSFSGIVCIGLAEDNLEKDNLIGDLFAVFGAVVYSVYSVCLKGIEGKDLVNILGCMGAINFVLFMPGLFLLHFSGFEKIETLNLREAQLIVGNALIGSIICDLCWARSVELLTPTICTLGLSLTIPISMAADKYLEKSEFGFVYIIGAFLVVVGFVMISQADDLEKPLMNDNEDLNTLISEIEI